jgi:hypothetical protein
MEKCLAFLIAWIGNHSSSWFTSIINWNAFTTRRERWEIFICISFIMISFYYNRAKRCTWSNLLFWSYYSYNNLASSNRTNVNIYFETLSKVIQSGSSVLAWNQ